MACPHLPCHAACLLSCRYDSDDYSQLHIDQKTGDDWRKVYSTPEKHRCYEASKVPTAPDRGKGAALEIQQPAAHAPCSQRPAAPSAAWCLGWPLANGCIRRRCTAVLYKPVRTST